MTFSIFLHDKCSKHPRMISTPTKHASAPTMLNNTIHRTMLYININKNVISINFIQFTTDIVIQITIFHQRSNKTIALLTNNGRIPFCAFNHVQLHDETQNAVATFN